MEENKTCCNALEGIVVIPLAEYRRLVYEGARNDIVRRLLMNEETSYIDTTTLRIAMGLKPIVHKRPNAVDPSEETADE